MVGLTGLPSAALEHHDLDQGQRDEALVQVRVVVRRDFFNEKAALDEAALLENAVALHTFFVNQSERRVDEVRQQPADQFNAFKKEIQKRDPWVFFFEVECQLVV